MGTEYDPNIYDAEWFAGQGFLHPWAQKLLGWFVGEFGPFGSSLDLGAGDGYWSVVLHEMGTDASVVELSDAALAVMPDCLEIFIRDLREPLNLHRTFDLVLCLEVAEHLPTSAADTLCETIARHCGDDKLLLFSAAPPGQAGHGHVNCQPPEYWREKLAQHGLDYLPNETAHIKRAWGNILSQSLDYLAHNVMLFRKAS